MTHKKENIMICLVKKVPIILDNFSSPFDMFNNFTNIFNTNSNPKPKKPNIKQKIINLELKDLYKGKNEIFIYQQNVKCDLCNGLGCKNKNDIIICDLCDGQGKIKNTKNGSNGISNNYKLL